MAALRRQLDAANTRLALYVLATDQMTQGLSMFGTHQRLLLTNTRCEEIGDLPPALCQPVAGFAETKESTRGVEWLPRPSSADGRPEMPNSTRASRREWLLDSGRCIAVTAAQLPGGEIAALIASGLHSSPARCQP